MGGEGAAGGIKLHGQTVTAHTTHWLHRWIYVRVNPLKKWIHSEIITLFPLPFRKPMIWERSHGCEKFCFFFFLLFFCRYMKPTWLDFFFLSFCCFLFLVHWKLKMNKNNPLFELCHHADHFVFAIALSCLSATFAMHSGCAYLSVWYLEQLEEMFNEWDSQKCRSWKVSFGSSLHTVKTKGHFTCCFSVI